MYLGIAYNVCFFVCICKSDELSVSLWIYGSGGKPAGFPELAVAVPMQVEENCSAKRVIWAEIYWRMNEWGANASE